METTSYQVQSLQSITSKVQEVVKGKTNEQGIAKFEKLPAGKYTYKETFAPEGYLINEETFSFEIKTDGEIIKHVVADQKKKFHQHKKRHNQSNRNNHSQNNQNHNQRSHKHHRSLKNLYQHQRNHNTL